MVVSPVASWKFMQVGCSVGRKFSAFHRSNLQLLSSFSIGLLAAVDKLYVDTNTIVPEKRFYIYKNRLITITIIYKSTGNI